MGNCGIKPGLVETCLKRPVLYVVPAQKALERNGNFKSKNKPPVTKTSTCV